MTMLRNRSLRWVLLLGGVFAFGCDPNPHAPTAVPPAGPTQPPEAAKVKADNPLINRD
jgi:hypothetical protein